MRSLLIGCVLLAATATAQQQAIPFITGVYGDARAILREGMSFGSLGINAIFVRSAAIDDALYDAARREGVRIYAEFPLLNGKDYVEQYPEAWPINEKGERAPPADWFMGVCLTDPAFRQFRERQLRELLGRYKLDGVWLDYLHWHAQFETPNPILPETCFCDRCTKQFASEMDIQLPGGEVAERSAVILSQYDSRWRLWRSRVLNDWVAGMKAITNELNPSALLGIYYCPWYPDDYNGAHYRMLGLDMKALAGIADVFSPMLYHHMMGRSPDWVSEYVQYLKGSGITDGKNPMIWPIVQAHNKPGTISPEEFRDVMRNGSLPPSSGIMMFTLHTLLDEKAKLDVMRDLYRSK